MREIRFLLKKSQNYSNIQQLPFPLRLEIILVRITSSFLKISNQINQIKDRISKRNAAFFDAEALKIEGWSDDLKNGLEYEIKELDRQMKETRKLSRTAISLEDKLKYQKDLRNLDNSRNSKRRSLFDAQDEIDKQREALINDIESRLKQKIESKEIFYIGWMLNA